MDIKPIVVRKYLESLTERDQLDMIFPILLESKGFRILTKPKEFKGFPQYGKDVVAVGKDFEDGLLKRFYFELKGGEDRHITTQTYKKDDGIRESLLEAKDKKFVSSYKNFDSLPLKIVLVHNGETKANVREVFEDFIQKEFPKTGDIEFGQWDISVLTKLFAENLFGAYLLTDQKTTALFNRVLVNLNVSDGVQRDFIDLIDVLLFEKENWQSSYEKTLPRKWKLIFESLKLISFILYTESKEYNNLEIVKRHLTHLILRFWYWILKNKLENNKAVVEFYAQLFFFYRNVLIEFFERTIPIAIIKDGLHAEKSGRYEQIGYTIRTFDYLKYLCFIINVDKELLKEKFQVTNSINILSKVLNNNSVSAKPLIDIHSLPIMDTLNLLIISNELEPAKAYLNEVFSYIKIRKDKSDILPDTSNSVENVIKLTVTGTKPIYYSDSTSPILAALLEYLAILDMKESYEFIRDFIIEKEIDLGIFVPHHGINSVSRHLIEDTENDLEEQLFSQSVNDGYQSDLTLKDRLSSKPISFEDFKAKIRVRKNEFEYDYRTDKAGFPFLKDLAHIYFNTPYFPDKWRVLLE
ncbi:MAG TPA: hypothetical protein VK151_02825 [Fluviicola sp.]|nr:hypothetical protein [Fluviicola sp.]